MQTITKPEFQLKLTHQYPKANGGSDSYGAVHSWNLRNWVKTNVCEHCGLYSQTHWANLDGRYIKGDRDTWAELCLSCHKKYDFLHKIGPNLSKKVQKSLAIG